MPTDNVSSYTTAGAVTGATAAGILYEADGRVLLVKRSAGSFDHPEAWAFPAGKIEGDETPVQAAVRESFEEVGYAPAALPAFVSCREDGFVLFKISGETFVPALNDEHSGFLWALPDGLPTPLHPGVAEALGVPTITQDRRDYDTNGWFEILDNPISKTGVFPYLGNQIKTEDGTTPEPGKVYSVYRPAEELSDPECLASFRLLPWTDGHTPLGPTAAGLTPTERKGVHGVIGEQVYFDGEYLRANIKCFAEVLAELIQSGKRELSAGYRCSYEYAPGVFEGQPYDYVQRRIRGNHLALVAEGRCGPEVVVLDSADFLTFSLDTKEATAMPDPKDTPAEGGNKIDVKSLTVGEFMALADEMAPILAQLKAQETAPAVTPDAEPPKADEDKPPVDPVAMDAKLAGVRADVFAEIGKRDALASKLSTFVGAFDHSGKTLAEVAAYGVEKLGLTCDAAHALPALEGYLAAASKPTPAVTFGQDAAPKSGAAVDSYLAGNKE